ncbi:MAG: 6-carboxyhexanoate--CoA ligase [Nitrospirae bacterium]|nr:MAG: 6-carboxyhexanoate--CoA ligase [Nitrospirota bacterium]
MKGVPLEDSSLTTSNIEEMGIMFSIRMHASRKIKSEKSKIKKTLNSKLSTLNSIHISGAEGIYEEADIQKVCGEYIKRALTHSRGMPDEIHITIEKIKGKPSRIPLLAVKTLKCSSADEAGKIITKRLSEMGIPEKAINDAFKVLKSRNVMRGASLMLAESGRRVEPDKNRGIRVSRMGIEKTAGRQLAQKLSKMRINSTTVNEALILASKVAAHPDIIAEVCISDDLDYTTGYIASNKFGYLRIPNIKRRGEMCGGRVFLIKENSDINRVIQYLEKMPVIIRMV